LPFCLGTYQKAFSEEYLPSSEEALLLELINEAREDPLAMAESLGMDRETVLRDLPELKTILTEGLAPLGFNERLYKAASGHTEDMISNSYYSHNSLDGRTYSVRINASGYFAAVCGESLGMVAFYNFMESADAVSTIFKSIFLAELDPATKEGRNILNPEVTEAGIALGAGLFTMGGSTWNAYLSTWDFGQPVAKTEDIELALVRILNSARNDPNQALLSAGIDPDSAAQAYGERAWALGMRLPPLALDENLHAAAIAHNRDMLDQLYFDTVSQDGSTPFERVASTGYDPAYVGEILGGLDATQADNAFDAARLIYESMLKNDVNPQSNAQRIIFDPTMMEVGIGVETIFLDLGKGDGLSLYIVVADFAEPVEQRSFLMGTVYEDRNKNGTLDEDEGVPGLKITLKPGFGAAGPESVTESGPIGNYQMSLSIGFMELIVERDGDVFGPFYVGGEGQNVLRNIKLEAD